MQCLRLLWMAFIAVVLWAGRVVWRALRLILRQPPRKHGRRGACPNAAQGHGPGLRKPAWVRREILLLNDALNGPSGAQWGRARRPAGCRSLAVQFNRLHAHRGVRVGKSFVAQPLSAQQLEALRIRHHSSKDIPAPVACQVVWAMDVTVLPQTQWPVVGLIDHGSRVLTALREVRCVNAWTVLGVLCLAIGQWGKPRRIRTDNASVFHSRVWRIGLRILGIKRQYSQPGCPWQNGRIERLFGTLKEKWAQAATPWPSQLPLRLQEFVHWYNARPHQHLRGQTPLEAWQDEMPIQRWRVVQAWGGALRSVVPVP